jgi:hypothetical protein
MWKQRSIRHPDIAKESLDAIKKSAQAPMRTDAVRICDQGRPARSYCYCFMTTRPFVLSPCLARTLSIRKSTEASGQPDAGQGECHVPTAFAILKGQPFDAGRVTPRVRSFRRCTIAA